MELEETEGRDIALVVQNIEKEDDVRVYLGRLTNEKDGCFFINQAQRWRVSVNADHMQGLRPVPNQLKPVLLNADYFFTMTMGTLPDTGLDQFRNTNLKWPE